MKGLPKHIHIVSFDVPYPANYGGVIDIFHKIKCFHKLGVKVHLHAYQYGRKESKVLMDYCHEVHYYKRKIFRNPFSNKKPYIVVSRNSVELIDCLVQDDYPILFEGLHSTFYLADKRLKDRKKIVRMHNIEHDYYEHLYRAEKNYAKKSFFKLEATRLKKYESVLKHADLIAAISSNDHKYLSSKFEKTFYWPPFHTNEEVTGIVGKGEFILYHGNLGVAENYKAAKYLINNVFAHSDYPFVVAGSNPTYELKNLIQKHDNIKLFSDISTEKIEQLIASAQINILHTAQATGIKLKLINALYQGRHCLVNNKMVDNTGLEGLCYVANNSTQYKEQIAQLWAEEFSSEEIEERKVILQSEFNNLANMEIFAMAYSSQKSKALATK
jgi:hypothetical protein